MRNPTTLELLVTLCARLRLATEAIGVPGDAPVQPRDIRLEDLSAPEQRRLLVLGRADLWALINEPHEVAPQPIPIEPPAQRGVA